MKKNHLWIVALVVGLFLTGFGDVNGQRLQKRLTKNSWEVYTVTKKGFSEETLAEMKEQKPRFGKKKNFNGQYFKFSEDGSYFMQSIPDYGRSDQEGTFSLNEDKMILRREYKKPNDVVVAKWRRKGKRKEKIVYLRGGNLVLESRRETIYMYRVRR